jgi:hypothetical protein
VTIEDPGVLTKPWVINRTTTLEVGFEMTEYVLGTNLPAESSGQESVDLAEYP